MTTEDTQDRTGPGHTHVDWRASGRQMQVSHLVATALVTAVFVGLTEALTALPVSYVPPFAAVTYLVVSRERPRRRFWAPGFAVIYGAAAGWVGMSATTALSGAVPPGAVVPLAAAVTVLVTGIGLWVVDVTLPPAFAAGLLVVVFDIASGRYLLTAAVGGVILTATALGLHLFVDHGTA